MTRPEFRAARATGAVIALSIDRASGQLLHAQLTEQLRRMILSGRIGSGACLPSSRSLAADLGVSRATVVAAFDQLASEGYVEGQQRSRLLVSSALPEHVLQLRPPHFGSDRRSAIRPMPPPFEPARPFQLGVTDPSLFPHEDWARRIYSCWRDPVPELLAPASPFGWPALRSAISRHLREWRGIVCDPAQIIITSGAFDALGLIAHVAFTSNDVVLVEEPGFPPVRHALSRAGLTLAPVAVDQDGFDVLRAPGKGRVRGALVTPSRQFPLGVTLPLARRLALLDWSRSNRSIVIEDDFDSEYRYEGAPLPALMSLDANARVIYMGSFSKVLSPALRLGFLVVPETLTAAFESYLRMRGPLASIVCQPALAEFIASGAYATHIRRTRRIYARRKAALMAASPLLHGLLEFVPASAGMHLVADLAPALARRMSDVEASDRARRAGVIVPALAAYFARPPTAQRHALLFGFAGFPEERSRNAIQALVASLPPPRHARNARAKIG